MNNDTKASAGAQFQPEGELNIYNAVAMKEEIAGLITQNERVIIDLSSVTEFDSAGLQILLFASLLSKRLEVEISWAGVSDIVRQVITQCRLESVFSPIFEG